MAITMAVYLVISLAVSFALNLFNARNALQGALSMPTPADPERPMCATPPTPSLPPPLHVARARSPGRAPISFRRAPRARSRSALAALGLWALPPLIAWATTQAVWSAPDGALCRAHQDGACWAFIAQKLDYLSYGSYPVAERWRVDAVEIVGAALIVWMLWPRAPRRGLGAALFFLGFPALAFVLLHGGREPRAAARRHALVGRRVRLPHRSRSSASSSRCRSACCWRWGAGRSLPIVKAASVVFIEFVRGVPFITVLYHGQQHAAAVPAAGLGARPLRCRPLVGIALFAAAYMAEEVRGGLQSLDKGQFEGAMALGLGYWRMMRLVVLPQALTLVIPGIVNNFIGLFKDTTLVAIVGMVDFLAAMDNAFKDPVWSGPTILATGYVFAGLFYFVFCYGMSRYSAAMERRLGASGERGEGNRGRWRRTTTIAIEFIDVHKWYGAFHVLRDDRSDRRARRAHRRLRPVGLGQVDADPLHQPAGGASARHNPRRRHRTDRRSQAHRRGAARSRHGVPAVQPVPASDDPGELHAGADLGAQDAQARGRGAGDELCSRGCKIPEQALQISRASCRAASSSASPSRAPCA